MKPSELRMRQAMCGIIAGLMAGMLNVPGAWSAQPVVVNPMPSVSPKANLYEGFQPLATRAVAAGQVEAADEGGFAKSGRGTVHHPLCKNASPKGGSLA